MPILKTISIAFLASAMALGAASAQDKVTIATEGAYEPWNFSRPDGTLDGFEIDLANDLCERMGVECEIIAQDWAGIIPALTAGRYDAIMAGMSITEEREQVISFAGPYTLAPNGILVRADSDLAEMPGTGDRYNLGTQPAESQAAIDTLREMFEGKAIGVQGSTTHANFVREYFGDVADVREYPTTEQHDLDLQAGRIDAIVAELPVVEATLRKPDFADEFVIVGPGFSGGLLGRGVGVGIRQEDEALREAFNTAIAEAIADGTVSELSLKWFESDIAAR